MNLTMTLIIRPIMKELRSMRLFTAFPRMPFRKMEAVRLRSR